MAWAEVLASWSPGMHSHQETQPCDAKCPSVSPSGHCATFADGTRGGSQGTILRAASGACATAAIPVGTQDPASPGVNGTAAGRLPTEMCRRVGEGLLV